MIPDAAGRVLFAALALTTAAALGKELLERREERAARAADGAARPKPPPGL